MFMGAGIGRGWIGHGGADGFVYGRTLFVGVLAHRQIIGIVVVMHAGDRQAELVLGDRVRGYGDSALN
jgi:hypothetical protein